MLGAAVRAFTTSMTRRTVVASTGVLASMQWALGATAGVGGAPALSLPEEEVASPAMEVPAMEVGALSGMGGNLLFVPGSISDAVEVGTSFVDEWRKSTGSQMAFVNANMPITDYPSQMMGLQSAKERNKKVEQGIIEFIENSADETVQIYAHSAGSKSALVAARRYLTENPTAETKKLDLVLMGAGSPEGGIQTEIDQLKAMGVNTTEIRDKSDFVPEISGSRGDEVVWVDSKESESRFDRIMQGIHPDLHELTTVSSDAVERDQEYLGFCDALTSMAEAHWAVESYLPAAVALSMRSQISPAALSMAASTASHASSSHAPKKKGSGVSV